MQCLFLTPTRISLLTCNQSVQVLGSYVPAMYNIHSANLWTNTQLTLALLKTLKISPYKFPLDPSTQALQTATLALGADVKISHYYTIVDHNPEILMGHLFNMKILTSFANIHSCSHQI